MISKILRLSFLASFIVLATTLVANGTSQHTEHEGDIVKGTQEFNAGDMIVEHVVDAHEWHIMTIGHTHISVPLPIILYQDGHLLTFSSSAFTNHETHQPAAVLYNKQWERLLIRERLHMLWL